MPVIARPRTKWNSQAHPMKRRSVIFLIDQNGIIRHIHPGGHYVKGDEEYAAMQSAIEELLPGTGRIVVEDPME